MTTPTPRPTPAEPRAHTCACCGRQVSLLVDDGDLCIRCDLLHYPPLGRAS